MCLFLIKNFKDSGMIFLQIPLNSDQHLNPSIFFFLRTIGVFWKFWQDLTENPNGWSVIKTFWKVDTLVPYVKNGENLVPLNVVLPKK